MTFETVFVKAFQYYSGNRFRPDINDEKWLSLCARLKDIKATPYELCYYVFTDEGKGIYTPNKLLWKNLLTSVTFWDNFVEYRNRKLKAIKTLVRLQRERYKAYLQYYDSPIALLSNKDYEMCSIVRLDLALLHNLETKTSIDMLFQMFLNDALLLANGLPEYLRQCPYFKNYCLLNKLLEEGAFYG